MKQDKFILLDGAMGTMLQASGLPMGHAPELWNLEHPEIITAVASRYMEAGTEILYANTFGANRLKLPNANIAEVIGAGIAAAKAAAKGQAKVALDVGPLGQLLEPLGTLHFDDAYDIFREIVVAGEAAGADLIVFETMSDLYEVKAAVLAAKEHTSLPVWVTMTFEKNARTYLGVTVPSMALTLTALGVDALGFNCSLGPKELLPLVKTLSEWTDLPMILKPNAGLPDPESGMYHVTPQEFAKELAAAVDLGVCIFGGCCGTTPEFIASVREMLSKKEPIARKKKKHHGVCSANRAVALDGVRVIGERINPTGKKRLAEALRTHDIAYLLEQGIEQEDAGADILDVNVGVPGLEEATVMREIIPALQGAVNLPLQIDSTKPEVLEVGLRYYNGKPIVNSVNGEDEVLDTVLPLCQKYGAAVIGLTMDKNGIPQTAEERIAIAEKIVKHAHKYGIPKEDIIIDCLTLTVSAQQSGARETLRALRHVHETMGLHTTLGVSNMSFGLPNRQAVTVAFLTEALANGLDLPIVNPNLPPVIDAIAAHKVLSGEDVGCEAYIQRFADGEQKTTAVAESKEMTINDAIAKGLAQETAEQTKKALEQMEPIDAVNRLLIPALDLVGEAYESGKIFLPQLIRAANAACAGFEVIKEQIAQTGGASVSRGKILVATVQGDIHDIGKNIVKVVLENYGYTVIDLGRDVPPEAVAEAAMREDIHLIGLSALMTTTVESMAKTVRALRESGHDCKIWVGGAVLTPEYAAEIGADFYAKDAKQSADIAKKVLG